MVTQEYQQKNNKLLQEAALFLKENSIDPAAGMALSNTLTAWRADETLITAGMLYPSLSTDAEAYLRAEKRFDKAILKMISAAKRIELIHQAKQIDVEALRKMMLGMVDDIRVVLLKLAEHLFLLQSAQKLPSETQRKIAQETMDYYAPLANRLGIRDLKWQLEDLAFSYLDPSAYAKITAEFEAHKGDRARNIDEMITILKKLLYTNGITQADYSGRVKHFYSIYKKISRKGITFEKLYDTSAIRIVAPTIENCYAALGLIHERWSPIQEEFNDYIAKPKPNGYQSIHTAVLRKDNTPIEIQIRTTAMHETAEKGMAAHWQYKEHQKVAEKESEKIHLLRELLDWQNAVFQEKTTLYRNAFHERVYVFSPEGEVFDLPQGATPLDFAYLVHTDIGHRCRGAKINDVLMPLTTLLKTGDHIDILTNKEAHPSKDWVRTELGYLKTIHAIRKVKAWYRKQDFDKNYNEGLLLWEKLRKQHHFEENALEKILQGFNLKKTDVLLSLLGCGEIQPALIVQKLTTNKRTSDEIILSHEKNILKKTSDTEFTIQGLKNLLTQLAQCCHPIPGDDIVGYITKNRGISIHQKKCKNIAMISNDRPERLIDIEWEKTHAQKFLTKIVIYADDTPGLLRDITGLFSQCNLPIPAIQSQQNKKNDTYHIDITTEIKDMTALEALLQKLRQIKGIISVTR